MICPRCDSVAALYALQNSMMLTPCWPRAGPTGGAGFAAPALICSLMIAASFFLGGIALSFSSSGQAGRVLPGPPTLSLFSIVALDLGDLAERQLDRRLASEDRDEDVQLLVHRVDVADRRRQGGERTVHDRDRFADLVVDGDLRLVAGARTGLARLGQLLGALDLGREDLHDLVQGQRGRTRGRPDETGDARGVADRSPRVVGQVHPDEDVAREDLALHLLALAVLDLDDLFGRDLDLEDELLHVQRRDPALEV